MGSRPPLDGPSLGGIVLRGPGSMGVDVSDIGGVQASLLAGPAHRAQCGIPFGMGLGEVVDVHRCTITHKLSKDCRPPLPCGLEGFQGNHRRAFPEGQSVPVQIKGTRGELAGQGLERIESGKHHLAQRIVTTGNRPLATAMLYQTECLPDRIGTGCTGIGNEGGRPTNAKGPLQHKDLVLALVEVDAGGLSAATSGVFQGLLAKPFPTAHRPGGGAQHDGNLVLQLGGRPPGFAKGFIRGVEQQLRGSLGPCGLACCEPCMWQLIRQTDLPRLVYPLPRAVKHRDVAESCPALAETGCIGLPTQAHRRDDTRAANHDAIVLLVPMELTVSCRHGNKTLTCPITVQFSTTNQLGKINIPSRNSFLSSMTLYQRWQTILQQNPDSLALTDWKSGRSWTFSDIQDELESKKTAPEGTVLFPKGWEVDLVFETLRAWRDAVVLCPIERVAPDPGFLDGIPDGIAHVKMTSGSTGKPKCILFTGRQLAADAANLTETMGLHPGRPNLGAISMAHSYGFSNLVTPLLLHGIPLLWLGDPLPGALSAVFEKMQEPCALPAVPAMWRTWAAAGILDRNRIGLAVSAGAPLSLELEERIYQDSGVKVHNFYGSSECGGIAYDRSDTPRSDPACVGTAVANVALEFGGPDPCLAVRSHAVAEGYWPPQLSDPHLGNGVFVTPDIAEITPGNAEVLLRARASDTINVAGRKVAPGKIEAAVLAADRHIRHCVVFGVPSEDPERVEDIIACVSTDNRSWDSTSLEAKISRTLARHELPRRWWLRKDLAPDSRGKLPRRIWREKFLDQKTG